VSVKIYLLKLQSSNWKSVHKAILKGGNDPAIIEVYDILELQPNEILIIPGVGNISSLVSEISVAAPIVKVREHIERNNIKIIGICLGFQFICSKSFEDENAECLNLFNCDVVPIFDPVRPFVGWCKLNTFLSDTFKSSLAKLFEEKDFYFTHSYAVKAVEIYLGKYEIYSYSLDGSEDNVAAIVSKNYIGYQFHPEKSGQHGIKLLSKSINLLKSNL
jgi:imidazole glycerol-phosphate synthase subunit HisH